MRKQKILLFMDSKWSLGRFFTDLTKYLYSYNIDCNLVDYSRLYNNEEFFLMARHSDYVVTNPSGIKVLPGYGVPLEKCIMLMFHTVDVLDVQRYNLDISKLAKIACINEDVRKHSEILPRPSELVHFGINTAAYNMNPATKLQTIGFGGLFLSRQDTQKLIDIGNPEPRVYKRGYLAQEIAQKLGLGFYAPSTYTTSFIGMPGFYNSIDSLLCCSTDEGVGGPVLEAGAAGRLPITTRVGGFDSFLTEKGGHGLPVDEKEYIDAACSILSYYKAHSVAFKDRCYEIQQYALKKYDLNHYIMTWIRLFS